VENWGDTRVAVDWQTVPNVGYGFALGVVANRVGIEVAAAVAAGSAAIYVLRTSWGWIFRIPVAAVLVVAAVLIAAGWIPLSWPNAEPRLEVRLPDGRPLDQQRIPVRTRKFGDPPLYEFSIGQLVMKEVRCRSETGPPVVRLYLSPPEIFADQMIVEPSDDSRFKSVLVSGPGLPVGKCDRRILHGALIRSKMLPPPEISAALKIHFGPPRPSVSEFTIVVGSEP
jgi:hypothetical protein